jgi:capsular polysaccharide transport system permease protein
MREIQTRWGRRNLGFAWLFAEPLVFAFPVLVLWSELRSPFEHGIKLMPFVWTSYLPVLIFRHVTSRALYVVRSNSALLYHSAITPLDIWVSRCGLEAVGNLGAVFFSWFVLYMLGVVDVPENTPLVIVGYLYVTWWSLTVALIVAALSERSEMVEHIWTPVSYMYLPVSGFIFMVAWLPTPIRGIVLLIDPPVHCYEMIRGGMFGSIIPTYYDIPYLTYILATFTLIGLWLMRHVRAHVEIL